MQRGKRLVVHEEEGLRVPDICGEAIEMINIRSSIPQKVSFALVILEPNAESKPHYHKKTEEVYFILEGSAIIAIDDEEFPVMQGHAVLLPIGSIHKIKNSGKGSLKIACSDSPPYDPNDVYFSRSDPGNS